jgi:hypothetical protein
MYHELYTSLRYSTPRRRHIESTLMIRIFFFFGTCQIHRTVNMYRWNGWAPQRPEKIQHLSHDGRMAHAGPSRPAGMV